MSVGKTNHLGQPSLAMPLWVGKLSTNLAGEFYLCTCLAQLVATLVISTKLLYAGPG